jgi:hypothetical protein
VSCLRYEICNIYKLITIFLKFCLHKSKPHKPKLLKTPNLNPNSKRMKRIKKIQFRTRYPRVASYVCATWPMERHRKNGGLKKITGNSISKYEV